MLSTDEFMHIRERFMGVSFRKAMSCYLLKIAYAYQKKICGCVIHEGSAVLSTDDSSCIYYQKKDLWVCRR